MLDPTLSQEDSAFLGWLGQIEEPQKVKVRIATNRIIVLCSDYFLARQLWRSRNQLDPFSAAPRELEIWVGKRLYAEGSVRKKRENTMQPSTTMALSNWAQQNSNLFQVIPGSVFLHSADADSGFKYLAVRPDISERRLNRPISELLNQPVRVTHEAIALPKERAMREAIATGENQNYHYQFAWQGLIWNFKVDVVPLAENNEILVIVQDADRHAWQREYWLNTAVQS